MADVASRDTNHVPTLLASSNVDGTSPVTLYADPITHRLLVSGTLGTVTSVSVVTANGVSGSVATSTSTPAITLTLGAITPTSVTTGAFSAGYTAQTSTYAILASDYTVNCTSGTFTVTLPTAVGRAGQIYVIKNSGAGTITIATTSAQTIDGSATQSISVQYNSYTVQSTGANWITI